MQHSILLLSLLGFLVVAAAGVFFLVNTTGEAPVVKEESLVGGIGLIENTILEKEEKEEIKEDQEKIEIATDTKEKVQIRQEPVKEEDVEVSTQILPVDILPEVKEKEEEEKEEAQEELQVSWCEVNLAVSPVQNTIIFNEIAWMGTLNSFQDEWIVPQTIKDSTLYS